jgi:hypothetical protein
MSRQCIVISSTVPWLGTLGALLASALACGEAGPTAPPSPSAPATLAVTGERSIRGRNESRQLQAIVTYSSGATQDVTFAARWASSDERVATVSRTGVATTVGFGTANVSADFQNVSGTLSIAVVPDTIEFTATSRGLPASPATCGGATFQKDGSTFYSQTGCRINGGRGFNVAAIDSRTGALLEPVRNFDTWYAGAAAASAMVEFLNRQPDGTLILIAVGDEGGLTVGATAGCPRDPAPGTVCCRPLGGEIERLRQTLEALGARDVRRYCYWNSYSLIVVKGAGVKSEQLVRVADAVSRYTLTLE